MLTVITRGKRDEYMKKLVEIKGLTKDFGAVRAVDNISFDLYEGEILGLLGPNGAGKTTTLQMLLGLITPSTGDIEIFGKKLALERSEILARVNFSSSYISLPFSLTVIENLRVFARLYDVKERDNIIDQLLETFEIEKLRHVSTRKLSSGQMTRVCLVKALLNNPSVLFLDEPTASLDPDIADKTRSLLRSIRTEKNISILYTSHNMAEMEEMCDRIIFLNCGQIVACGRPAELLKEFGSRDLEEVFLKIARSGC